MPPPKSTTIAEIEHPNVHHTSTADILSHQPANRARRTREHFDGRVPKLHTFPPIISLVVGPEEGFTSE